MAILLETAKKKYEEVNAKEKEDQWVQVQKIGKSVQEFKKKGKSVISDPVAGTTSIPGLLIYPKMIIILLLS